MDTFPRLARLPVHRGAAAARSACVVGELISESAGSSSLRVSYSAEATAWAVVDRRPTSLVVNGAASALVAVADPSGGYTVRLPSGDHEVKLSF